MSAAGSKEYDADALALMAFEPDELRKAGLNCLVAGQAGDAEALFRAGAMRSPRDIDFRYRLVSALLAQDRFDEAQLAIADAINMHGRSIFEHNSPAEAARPLTGAEWTQIGHAYYGQNQVTTASYLFHRAIEANPDDLNTVSALGLSLLHQGRLTEAAAAFQSIVRRIGRAPQIHSFLHYTRVFQQTGPQTLYEEGVRWRALNADILPRRPARKPRADGRLKVGYFSPTFNGHQLAHFFLPVLEAHDRERFEIYCYSGGAITDDVGRAVEAACDHLRPIAGLDDQAFCALVESDGIDILVDLWGHNAGNRLLAFAAKPAPVQVSWLNYSNTTGLETFDALLLPDGLRAEGDQSWFSEPIRSLGPVVAPFRSLAPAPSSGPTPALTKGCFTFASAAHPGKVNLDVVRVWSQILLQSPDAVLELRYSYFSDPALRRAVVAMFESCGVPADRVVFPPHLTGAAFREALQQADLILDPFPYQGFTTTLDALEVGAPVLAYEGDYLATRVAAAALRACGLDELVATDFEDYVAKAVALAGDPHATDRLRKRVKPAFEASPFRDEAGFARRIEQIYLDLVAEAR